MLRVKIFILLVLLSFSHGEIRQQQKTQLRPVIDRVFSRRKRAIIFPPGSFLKFTCNFGKSLMSKFPRGITFNLEEAVYFPIPGTRDDLYPKRFLPKKTTTATNRLTTTTESYVYIPGTEWRFKAQALPKSKPRLTSKPPKTHRIDDVSAYSNPHNWQQWSRYGSNQAQKWQSSAKKQEWLVINNKNKWSKWTSPAPKWSADWTRNKWHRSTQNSAFTSPHYHGHRDRRQLFDLFNGLSSRFGMNIKACILRTICDSKRLLLPPGYSMLQDMLRLVFTMPRLDGLEDEYTRAMSKNPDACSMEIKTKCDMNLLIWLLSGRLDKTNAAN